MFHTINKNKMKLIIAGCHHGKGDVVCEIDKETGIETCTVVPPKKHCKTHRLNSSSL